MSQLSFEELETAALAVIATLKEMPEFSDAKVVVIGGLGVWKYIRTYRSTKDVDFLITVQGAPKAVKEKLLAIPSSQFQQQAQDFYYKTADGKLIQVDITPDWQSPYIPSAALPISAISPGSLPYISELDLLVFKINCCGLRSSHVKKSRDAFDAKVLVEDIYSKLKSTGPILLSPHQKDLVLQGLDDVMKFVPGSDWAWWASKLELE